MLHIRHAITTGAVALLVATTVAAAYVAHSDSVDPALNACDLYTAPQGQGVGDGHLHDHRPRSVSGLAATDPCNQEGLDIPVLSVATGRVPNWAEAQLMPSYRIIIIDGDAGFTSPVVIGASAPLVIPGSGTLTDPYVISGIHVTEFLDIRDTDACFVVRDSYFSYHLRYQSRDYEIDIDVDDFTPGTIRQTDDIIPTTFQHTIEDGPGTRYTSSQLRLNWNGQCIHAHDNHISDLRVNQNNHRDGYATGGFIEQNHIEFLGQLRHYDGYFQDNIVGLRSRDAPSDMHYDPVVSDLGNIEDKVYGRIANVDGFNQGVLRRNIFHGSVDLDLHGHHHGQGFYAPHSHYHGDDAAKNAAHVHNHHQRWTRVAFEDNVVVDPLGYGLRYEDVAHDADDRWANSENNTHLQHPHRHQTHIAIVGNEIRGARIWVDIFNSDGVEIFTDPYGTRVERNETGAIQNQVYADPANQTGPYGVVNSHLGRNEGWLDILGNTIYFEERSPAKTNEFQTQLHIDSGIRVERAKEAAIRIADNNIVFNAVQPVDANDGYVTYWTHSLEPPTPAKCDTPDPNDPVAAAVAAFNCAQANAGAATSGFQGKRYYLKQFDGIEFFVVKDSQIVVESNTIAGPLDCAVHGAFMDAAVTWTVRDNVLPGVQSVTCSTGVANAPTVSGNVMGSRDAADAASDFAAGAGLL